MSKRAYSVKDIQEKKFNSMAFQGEWKEALGIPERTGCWLIWGPSANGKTRFALQLARYLTQWGKVAYNSLEEGISLSLQGAFLETGMDQVADRIQLLDKEPIDELRKRLGKQRSADIIFIDSIQFARKSYMQLKKLVDEFPRKLFIFISHAEGKEPAGRVAKTIKYLAFIKIRVEGFKAFAQGRYGGGKPYTVWRDGAAKYW